MLVSRSGPTMMARIAVMKALNSGADGNLIGCHGKLIRSAQSGKRTVIDLQNAGLKILKATAKPTGFTWFGLRRFYSR